MNSDKHKPAGTSGNAMIYILLALALLGGLTMVLSRGASTGGDDLTGDRAELATTRMVAYAGSAKNVIDQMMMSGSTFSNINLVRPNETSFETGVHIHKVFHPGGGGLSYAAPTPDMFITATDTPLPGWYLSRDSNVEWTQTTADDLVLVGYRIQQGVCEKINQKITGTADIPVVGGTLQNIFLPLVDGGGIADLDSTNCPDCEGYPSLCVTNAAGTDFAYYNIISAQ